MSCFSAKTGLAGRDASLHTHTIRELHAYNPTPGTLQCTSQPQGICNRRLRLVKYGSALYGMAAFRSHWERPHAALSSRLMSHGCDAEATCGQIVLCRLWQQASPEDSTKPKHGWSYDFNLEPGKGSQPGHHFAHAKRSTALSVPECRSPPYERARCSRRLWRNFGLVALVNTAFHCTSFASRSG